MQYSLAPVSFTNEKGCTVDTSLWLDPYTGNFYILASDLDVEYIAHFPGRTSTVVPTGL
ncbi:hypothetical protein [Microbulbifer sp. PSTR4-B]|uniref:hypothetical protein n=1 Tax=Microbulbifer sp. PSTR4-B TaxID=3243396 RepID=UPI004039A78A